MNNPMTRSEFYDLYGMTIEQAQEKLASMKRANSKFADDLVEAQTAFLATRTVRQKLEYLEKVSRIKKALSE